ncbi:MAG: hypothetical protein HMLKMBBP_01036 [Planctomycetes bacterium]|nr:hypothetical protein [Planctomycetota bacterium]
MRRTMPPAVPANVPANVSTNVLATVSTNVLATVLAILLAAPLAACGTTRPFDARRDSTPGDLPGGAVEVAAVDASGILLVPVLVDGKGPFWFALDTGASTVVVSQSCAESAGLRTEERKADILTEIGRSIRTVDQTTIREIRVGPAPFKRVGALVADLTDLSRAIGRTLDGILGMPVLRHHVWTIDHGDHVVTIHSEHLGEPDGLRVLAVDLREEVPMLPVTVAGRRVAAMLDTGQRAPLALDGEEARHLAPRLSPAGRSYGQVLDGTVERDVMRLDGDVVAGAIRLERPLVVIARGTRLGLGALEGGRLTLDFPRGRIAVDPESVFSEAK